jgi:hypothetical protein
MPEFQEIRFQDFVNDKAPERASSVPGHHLLEAFARQAAYSGIQTPIDAITQLPDKAFGTKIKANAQFIDVPPPTEFMSADWHAAQVGTVVGTLPWIVGLHKGFSTLAGRTMEGTMANRIMTNSLVQSAVVGGMYGGLLLPSEGEGHAFLAGRLRNAGITSATMVTLTGSNMLLGDSLGSGRAASALKGGISGLGAGLVNRELYSLTAGQGLVVDRQMAEGMYTFAMLGAANGALFPEVHIRKTEKGSLLRDVNELKELQELRSNKTMDDPAQVQRLYELQAASKGGAHTFLKADAKPGQKGYAEYQAWKITPEFLSKNPGFKVSTSESPIQPDGTGGQVPHSGDFVMVKLGANGLPEGTPWTPGAEAMQLRYKPVDGKPGIYSPRAVPTEMVPLDGPLQIKTSWGTASGNAGDLLVRYGTSDFNIVTRADLARLYAHGADARSAAALTAIQGEMQSKAK